jgi:hypothetical protein
MNFSLTNKLSLKTRIMMSVWKSYLTSVIMSMATLRGVVLGASVVLFIQLVSVYSIISNLLHVQVGTVPTYVWQAISTSVVNGEFLKLLTLGVIIFSLLSLRFNFRQTAVSPRFSHSV